MLIDGYIISLIATVMVALVAVINLKLFRAYASTAFPGPATIDRFEQAVLDEKNLTLYDERQDEISHAITRMILPYLLPVMFWWLMGMLLNAHPGMYGIDPVLDIALWVAAAGAIATSAFVFSLVLHSLRKLQAEKTRVASLEAAMAPSIR